MLSEEHAYRAADPVAADFLAAKRLIEMGYWEMAEEDDNDRL